MVSALLTIPQIHRRWCNAQADTACHAAKDEGRNRYHLYHVEDEDLRQRQMEMESVSLVHEALANDRLELFAQRILDLNDADGQKKDAL